MPTPKPIVCQCGKRPYANKRDAERAYPDRKLGRCGRCRAWRPEEKGRKR